MYIGRNAMYFGKVGAGGDIVGNSFFCFWRSVNFFFWYIDFKKVEEKKWQLRKESLDALLPLTQNPKLLPGDYNDLVKVLKKFINKVISKLGLTFDLILIWFDLIRSFVAPLRIRCYLDNISGVDIFFGPPFFR